VQVQRGTRQTDGAQRLAPICSRLPSGGSVVEAAPAVPLAAINLHVAVQAA
jgi:hypothetical protein